MRLGLLITWLACLSSTGCASHLSTARDYAARGKHELAVHYLGSHYRSDRSPEAKAELVRSVENAVRSLEAGYQDLIEQGLSAAALGAATRLEDLYDYARRAGLGEFSAVDGGRLVKQAWPLALSQAVQLVDRSEADGRPAKEQTALLRKALALDPHNPELSQRYDRVLASLRLSLALKTECPGLDQGACRQFIDRLTTRLSEERREFTQLVSPTSGIKNAELVATVKITASENDWQRTKNGKAEKDIEVKNKYRETRMDSDGEKITRKISARYQVFERSAQATVKVFVKVDDLRGPGGLLLETSRQWTETDRRRYITWTGDQRALGELARIGTDQTPPGRPEDLARIASAKVADMVAKLALELLEGTGQ